MVGASRSSVGSRSGKAAAGGGGGISSGCSGSGSGGGGGGSSHSTISNSRTTNSSGAVMAEPSKRVATTSPSKARVAARPVAMEISRVMVEVSFVAAVN